MTKCIFIHRCYIFKNQFQSTIQIWKEKILFNCSNTIGFSLSYSRELQLVLFLISSMHNYLMFMLSISMGFKPYINQRGSQLMGVSSDNCSLESVIRNRLFTNTTISYLLVKVDWEANVSYNWIEIKRFWMAFIVWPYWQ